MLLQTEGNTVNRLDKDSECKEKTYVYVDHEETRVSFVVPSPKGFISVAYNLNKLTYRV